MGSLDKTLNAILSGVQDASINFGDLVHLLLALGFIQRIKGDHHIFTRQGVVEIINLQPKGSKAKPYQVKQVRNIILRYKLGCAMSRYEIVVYWSDEDDCYIAEVPELPGCMADGADRQEVVRNVELVIDQWLETAQEEGRPIPVPKGRLMYA